jgi:hypothetical protein
MLRPAHRRPPVILLYWSSRHAPMAILQSPERRRPDALFLLATAGALQTLAGTLAMPDSLLLCLSGLAGPLVLALACLRARTAACLKLIGHIALLLALLAVVAVIFAVASPRTALGPLIVLWGSWVVALPVCAWLRARSLL